MGTLRQAWQGVIEGHGQIVLVDGEPGIGKTRLIEELLAEVAGQAVILRAKCPELETPLAYTLLADPLREALSADRPSELSDTWLAEVSRILPELRDRYPNLPRAESLDPAAERRRLFDAICATLLALTASRPLVLFEDDLQWADATSLELLNHLSGRTTKAPVLILGTYRSNEVGPDHPLQRPRRDWQRAGLMTELSLAPLSDEAVVALLRELTTWPGDEPSFGDLVYRETAGNPLFVVETVASLRDEGRLPQDAEGWHRDFRAESVTIPTQVQTLIETRLDRLDDLSRQIGTTAAILRGSFTAEVVQTVSGRNEWETLEGLEQLLAGGLLAEQGPDRFNFSHDKIREVAYHSLSHLRRKLLHRRVAETLEKRHRGRENTMAERLAYHYEQADLADKALVYHTQAGDKAREQYAHEAAIDHYQKALSYLKEQDDYETAARMLMKLGLLFHNIFDFQQARRAYEEGFALRRKAGEMKPATLPPAPHPLRLVSDNPPTLDPAIATDTTSEKIIDQLFSGLVRLSPDLDVMPEIAKSWEVLGGGSSYLFHLRDDMRWNDGVPVTAEDFVYAWRRVLNPATNSPNAGYFSDIKGASAFHQGQLTDPTQVGVRALGAATLLVELEGPTGYFPQLLKCPAFYPVPRHIVEVQGQAWTEKQPMVTNGPFQLEAWQQGQSMVLSRNPDYRGRFTGNVQRLELSLDVASPAEQLAMYEANRLDMVTLSPSPQADRIRQQWAEGYFSEPWLDTQYILFNMRKAPFNDLRVRRAFAMAIDKETLANLILRGFDLPASGGIVPPGMPGHSPGIGLPYKPDEARRLLAEAGYPSGQNFPVLECLAYSHELEAVVVDYLQQQWRENLGVEIRHRAVEWGTVLDQMDQGRFHLARNGWTMDYPDPDNILRVAAVSRNWSGWRNETFIALVEEARRITNQVERLEVYRRAEKILVEEAAWVPLTYRQQHLLVKPWVRRFSPSAIDRSFWEDIVIEPHDELRQSRGEYGEGSYPPQRIGKSQPATSPPAARVLRLAWPDLETLDAAVSGMWHIYDRLFSGLVAESPESEVEPEVARSWEILEGGRKYLFHLRTDVRWSDGVLLTAEDFEVAWKRVLDPATGAPYASLLYDIKRARAFHLGEISDPDQVGVQALDEVTLAVELEEPSGYFLHLLTNATMLPVPRHVIAAYGDDWAAPEHAVTNGPFRIEAWRRGESMVLIRDPDYHGRFTGNVERIELRLSAFDPVTNLALYEANRLDVFVDYHTSPEMDRIRQQNVQEYVSAPWLQVSFICFDLGRPPFDDPRVRRAFTLAIDREKLANVALRGDVLPATWIRAIRDAGAFDRYCLALRPGSSAPISG
jgi:oligopeptide transport system substrate-binding protein